MLTASLMQHLYITEEDIQRRLKIVGFGDEDRKRVLALSDLIVRQAEDYTKSFFAHLASLDEASGFINNPAAVQTAWQLKREHLVSMVQGTYGPSYVEERLRLGQLYAEAKLDPRVFLGAYHHLMRTIRFRIMEDYRLDPVEGFAHFVSLEKIAFFDLSLIIDTIAYERERLIHDQHNAILLLSTPVLRVRKHLLILPLIGVIDPERAKRFTETLLEAVRLYRAKVVVVDLTGVAGMDVAVTNHLAQTMLAARLIGATTILTGMSPSVAETINTVCIDTTLLKTALDLEAGIEEAERMIGHTAA